MPDALVAVAFETVPWEDMRAVALREAMDAEIAPRYAGRLDHVDPAEADRMSRALAVDPGTIAATVLMLSDGEPVGHAALRDLGAGFEGSLEVKRVYVVPEARGTGASRRLMAELERLAAGSGAHRLILQTGDRQPEAVALYERIGYSRIPVYPPYLPITFSQCFEKAIER